MIGVERLTVFVSSDKFESILLQASRLQPEEMLPNIQFSAEVQKQLREVLQNCVATVEHVSSVQD